MGGNVRSRGKCDAAEAFVVQFQCVSGLLDLPVTDSSTAGQLREERLDFGASQVSALSVWVGGEKLPDPSDAIRDCLFLSPRLSKNGDVPIWPLGCLIERGSDAELSLRHISSPAGVICLNVASQSVACQHASCSISLCKV